jgi:hypothetical protein
LALVARGTPSVAPGCQEVCCSCSLFFASS